MACRKMNGESLIPPVSMNWNEFPDIRPGKVAELKARLERLGLDLARVEEEFTRGGGKGGQKINKTANRVVLRYSPLDLVIRCQSDRRRSVNRFLALRRLADAAELKLSPATAPRTALAERLKRRKARRRARSREKYGEAQNFLPPGDTPS